MEGNAGETGYGWEEIIKKMDVKQMDYKCEDLIHLS
jgi:hypothetical protein